MPARPGAQPAPGLPIVAIVGRPNVGKSTLFNRIVGRRSAIVEDRARTTRDRLYGEAEWNGRQFVVVDTGGLERRPGDPIEAKVQEQARAAIDQADVIVLVVDAAAGETPADLEAAELLRGSRVPVLVAVNKADNARLELEGTEFHRLGWDETYAVSAMHGRGTGDLLDALVWALPPETEEERERRRRESAVEDVFPGEAAGEPGAAAPAPDLDEPISIAIVGRPNVGKSSLLNALLGEERSIVSDIPGTTRDAIDTAFAWGEQPLTLIDTAGLRRRGKVASGPDAERFSALRAFRAIARADVTILVLDAVDGLTRQDAHVAGYVVDEGKGLLLALNKWDLVERETGTFEAYVSRIRAEAPFLDFAPVLAISARTGQRIDRVIETAIEIARERRVRIPTGELNRLLADATQHRPPPSVRGKRTKFFYATQATVAPPTIVCFVSDADAVHFSYARYLENRVRAAYPFTGSPVRLVLRTRTQGEAERERRRGPRFRRGSQKAGATRSRR